MTSDDLWGDARDHWFAVTEVAYHGGATIPPSWGFRDGAHTDADYLREVTDEATGGQYPDSHYVAWLDAGPLGLEMLLYTGRVLARYLGWLRRAGWEY